MDVKLKLDALEGKTAAVSYEYTDADAVQYTGTVRVDGLPVQGASQEFVAAATAYMVNFIGGQRQERAAKAAEAPSAEVAGLVGKATTVTIE